MVKIKIFDFSFSLHYKCLWRHKRQTIFLPNKYKKEVRFWGRLKNLLDDINGDCTSLQQFIRTLIFFPTFSFSFSFIFLSIVSLLAWTVVLMLPPVSFSHEKTSGNWSVLLLVITVSSTLRSVTLASVLLPLPLSMSVPLSVFVTFTTVLESAAEDCSVCR